MYRTDENDCSGPIATQVQNDPGFYEDIYNQLPKDVRAPLDGAYYQGNTCCSILGNGLCSM